MFQAHSAVKADDGWLIVSSSAGDYNLLFINLSGPDAISAFHGIDADDENVYVIYSGHKIRNDVLPSNECRHFIVYDGDTLWCASEYPESCVYRFELPNFFEKKYR